MLNLALEFLNELIESGIEFPQAEYKTLLKFNVNQVDLLTAYDNQ